MQIYDKIIIGGGLYGIYSADFSVNKGEKVLLLEYDNELFKRATYINQARVHNGYHYPRSYSTAIKSAKYFDRFNKDFGFCINSDFQKIYATSSKQSWTNSYQFEKMAKSANIKCEKIEPTQFFKDKMCDGAFITKEYTYDANILKNYFFEKLIHNKNLKFMFNARINTIKLNTVDHIYDIILKSGETFSTKYLLNSTYASVNQILTLIGYENFKIKYELCEIILCDVSKNIKNIGITVMDGPFFSLMPFGRTEFHSLTSVTFTPHITSYNSLPEFKCNTNTNLECTKFQIDNCNNCSYKPKTAWNYMSNLAKKYLKYDINISYVKSLFSVKPILLASEIDDSRPTLIKKFSDNPTFISVLSGKINTVYDLNEVL